MPDPAEDSFVGALDPADGEKRINGPGEKHMGAMGIVLLALYLMGAVVICLYGLLLLWPTPTPSRNRTPEERSGSATTPGTTASQTDKSAAGPSEGNQKREIQKTLNTSDSGEVVVFGRTFTVADEIRLLLIVMLAGALGSLVHSIRSFFWYIGNRELVWSWTGKYLMQPFA